ncbi:MucR family transcriptional regulator [Desulfobaculum bizertense]|uniref:Transcriptional regulator, MucR family n=1 Tax=Desulfobaculum bizertense DSM 18034 TaxID=1121442 RepID=A0A1T4WKD8_9BACT|nr:MucR family transcriptional regulator [Desulfobaculum bizertense]UIJ37093.1 MucR family transcriptional regulator [Desulfobaculum bizertense]SKA77816.1 transcriptional regulator, MucR family [Desulfobaculum bizertense DSM 18034]
MDDYLKEALEIVKAQASVRTLTEDEITSMVRKLSEGIRQFAEGKPEPEEAPVPPVDPKKAIREKSIINLEDGKPYKILTKKNLAKYGITPDEYREKWGYKKGTPLICKALQRERRKKMKDMKLWEKRKEARKKKAEK